DGFQSVIKKIGGVMVDIPKKIVLDNVTLHKGKQLLNAETAMKFVRERHSYANQDLGRMEMQKLFMKSLIEKMFEMPKSKIVSLAPNILKDVTTDLNIKTVLEYYEDIIKVDKNNNINFHMLPTIGGARNGKVSVLSIKKEETAKLLNEKFRPHSNPVESEDLGVIELITNYK
ncbi:MAG: LCP family protein, partial [Oscillospiraceae bacterium]